MFNSSVIICFFCGFKLVMSTIEFLAKRYDKVDGEVINDKLKYVNS